MDSGEKIVLAVLFFGSLAAIWAGLTSIDLTGLVWASAAVVLVLFARIVQGNAHQREFNHWMKTMVEKLDRIEKQKKVE